MATSQRLLCLGAVFGLALLFHGDSEILHSTTRLIEPPSEFYSENLDCGGIMIRAHRIVSDGVLPLACEKINMMLRHLPNVRANLVAAGVEMHIVADKQRLTDLPEFSTFKGKKAGDEYDQLRGTSGITAVCSEENLLELPDDIYSGNEDVCVHEFAHAVQIAGVSKPMQQLIEQRFHQALAERLWEGAYAASNQFEFFAEISTWYFGAHGFPPKKGSQPGNGSDGLMLYDPKTFELVDDIYGGRFETPKVIYTQAERLKSTGLGRSATAAAEGMLVFTNQTSSSLKLFWIDTEGHLELWADVAPYQRIQLQNSAGYRWLVSNERNEHLSIFVARSSYSLAALDGGVLSGP